MGRALPSCRHAAWPRLAVLWCALFAVLGSLPMGAESFKYTRQWTGFVNPADMADRENTIRKMPDPIWYHAGTQHVIAADMNGDDVLDVLTVVNTRNPYYAYESAVYVTLGLPAPVSGYLPWVQLPLPTNARDRMSFSMRAAVGDFNGDGFMDVLVANRFVENWVYLSDSSLPGGFAPPVNVSTPEGPYGSSKHGMDVAVGDVNGDGLLDCIFANGALVTGGSPLNMLHLGKGGGNFTAGTPVGSTGGTKRIELVDMNNDGALDLVEGNLFRQQIVYYPGDGSGGFGPGVAITDFEFHDNAFALEDVQVADMNGDSHLDVVYSFGTNENNSGVGGVGGTEIQVRFADGNGGFNRTTKLPPSAHDNEVIRATTGNLAVGDLNGDGYGDILALSKMKHICEVYYSNGSGGFQPRFSIRVDDEETGKPLRSAGYGTPVIADMNQDGILDIIISHLTGDGIPSITSPGGGMSLHLGDNAIALMPEIVTDGVYGTYIVAMADGLAALDEGRSMDEPCLYLLKRNGEVNRYTLGWNRGEHGEIYPYPYDDMPSGMNATSIAVDFFEIARDDPNQPIDTYNGDSGRPINGADIVMGTWNAQNMLILTRKENKNQVRKAIITKDEDNTNDVAIGRMGGSDVANVVAVANQGAFSKLYFRRWFSQGLPSGSDSVSSEYFYDEPYLFMREQNYTEELDGKLIRLVDLDGDGLLDVLLAFTENAQSNSVRAYFGQGNGTYPPPPLSFSEPVDVLHNNVSLTVYSLDVSDVNGDGHLDVVVGTSKSAVISYADGQRGYQETEKDMADYQRWSSPLTLTTGDLNGDGRDDMIWQHPNYPYRVLQYQLPMGNGSTITYRLETPFPGENIVMLDKGPLMGAVRSYNQDGTKGFVWGRHPDGIGNAIWLFRTEHCRDGQWADIGATYPKCELCPRGAFCQVGYRTHEGLYTKCPAGRVNPYLGQSTYDSCEACLPGTFRAEEGQSLCHPCAAGSFQPSPASAYCELCAPGTWSSTKGNKSERDCTPCPAGTYSSVAGSVSNATCADCPAGSFQPSPASASCELCAPGTWSSTRGNKAEGDCTPCPAGTYSLDAGSVSNATCAACPAATPYSEPGSPSPMSCRALNPAACPAGQWSLDGSGQQPCAKCRKGHHSPRMSAKGEETCVPCPPGTFAGEEGLGACDLCPAGLMAPSQGAEQCASQCGNATRCPAGSKEAMSEQVHSFIYQAEAVQEVKLETGKDRINRGDAEPQDEEFISIFGLGLTASQFAMLAGVAASVVVALAGTLLAWSRPGMLKRLDVLFRDLHPPLKIPAPLIVRQTSAGGVFTLVVACLVPCVFAGLLLQHLTSNEITSASVSVRYGEKSVTEYLAVQFNPIGPGETECGLLSVAHQGWQSQDLVVGSAPLAAFAEGSGLRQDLPATPCVAALECRGCRIEGKEARVEFELLGEQAYVQGMVLSAVSTTGEGGVTTVVQRSVKPSANEVVTGAELNIFAVPTFFEDLVRVQRGQGTGLQLDSFVAARQDSEGLKGEAEAAGDGELRGSLKVTVVVRKGGQVAKKLVDVKVSNVAFVSILISTLSTLVALAGMVMKKTEAVKGKVKERKKGGEEGSDGSSYPMVTYGSPNGMNGAVGGKAGGDLEMMMIPPRKSVYQANPLQDYGGAQGQEGTGALDQVMIRSKMSMNNPLQGKSL